MFCFDGTKSSAFLAFFFIFFPRSKQERDGNVTPLSQFCMNFRGAKFSDPERRRISLELFFSASFSRISGFHNRTLSFLSLCSLIQLITNPCQRHFVRCLISTFLRTRSLASRNALEETPTLSSKIPKKKLQLLDLFFFLLSRPLPEKRNS